VKALAIAAVGAKLGYAFDMMQATPKAKNVRIEKAFSHIGFREFR
jgi:hypothetical protein